MAGEGNGFRLITVHEDELVIHAGSGATSTASQAAAVPTGATEAAAGHAEEAAADGAGTAPATEASARQEVLRRKAEELARAEEGLENPHAFAKTHIYVLVALALLVIAVVVYTFAMRA